MKATLGLSLGLVLVTALVFGGVVGHDFLSWDDDVFIYQNPKLQPPTWDSLKSYWTAPYAHLYVPVPYTIWWVIARLWGQVAPAGQWTVSPAPLHAASLLFHVLNVLLVLALLRRLVRHGGAAFAGALLYAVHPLQVETVAWLSELKDLSSGTFSLAALWLFIAWLRHEAPARWSGRARLLPVLATLAFVLALLSKPNTVTVPLVAAVLAVVLERQSARRWGWLTGLWLLLAGAYAVFTRGAQPISPDLALPLGHRLLVAGDTLAFYLGKALWPTRLTADYGRTPQLVVGSTWGYLTWLAPVALGGLAMAFRRRWPCLLAGVGCFLLPLLPASGLAPFDFQQYSTPADHYAYVALFGPALLLAAFLAMPRRFLVYGLCGIGLALLASLSYLQTLTWQNNVSFWTHTLQVNSRSWLAHNNLGATYQMQGRPDKAIEHYQAALELKPEDADALINLGLALYAAGRGAEALPHLQRGLWLRPGDPKALLLSGRVLLEARRPAEALEQFTRLVGVSPGDVTARHGLAQCLLALNRRAEAIVQLRALVRDFPGYSPAQVELDRLTRP